MARIFSTADFWVLDLKKTNQCSEVFGETRNMLNWFSTGVGAFLFDFRFLLIFLESAWLSIDFSVRGEIAARLRGRKLSGSFSVKWWWFSFIKLIFDCSYSNNCILYEKTSYRFDYDKFSSLSCVSWWRFKLTIFSTLNRFYNWLLKSQISLIYCRSPKM